MHSVEMTIFKLTIQPVTETIKETRTRYTSPSARSLQMHSAHPITSLLHMPIPRPYKRKQFQTHSTRHTISSTYKVTSHTPQIHRSQHFLKNTEKENSKISLRRHPEAVFPQLFDISNVLSFSKLRFRRNSPLNIFPLIQ
jgi:hypothetical protein